MPRLRTILCLLPLTLSFGGCSSAWRPSFLPAPEVRVERVTVPADLLTCAAEPEPLADQPRPTQAEFGVWVELVRAAGADCRAKLGEVKRMQE